MHTLLSICHLFFLFIADLLRCGRPWISSRYQIATERQYPRDASGTHVLTG